MQMAGQLIRMFLADGISEGIKTLELSNKTIFCTVFPRPMFEQFKHRKENNRPGVYILVGQDEKMENTKIYIGEGDPVGPRLYSHYGNKDFWTEAIVMTSKDDYLTKTQIQFLESKLISAAIECGQVLLDNGNLPQLPNISEADEAEVSGFLASLYLFIKALGYDFFVPLVSFPKNSDIQHDTLFEIKNRNGSNGKMLIRQGKYVLLKNSTAVIEEQSSASDWVRNNRKKLTDKKLLVDEGNGFLVLKEDTEFKSPSGAASVIVGGNINGFRAWKSNGKSLAEYEIK